VARPSYRQKQSNEKLKLATAGKLLLLLLVVEDPTHEQYASHNDYQRNNDANRRSHLFDQVEDHSHVLIPIGFGLLFA
jgi:hypothetical protein